MRPAVLLLCAIALVSATPSPASSGWRSADRPDDDRHGYAEDAHGQDESDAPHARRGLQTRVGGSGPFVHQGNEPYWGTMRPYWNAPEPPGVIYRGLRTRGLKK